MVRDPSWTHQDLDALFGKSSFLLVVSHHIPVPGVIPPQVQGFVCLPLIQAFLVVFHISQQIQLQIVFGFPNWAPVCLDRASIYFAGYLTLISTSVYSLFMSGFS